MNRHLRIFTVIDPNFTPVASGTVLNRTIGIYRSSRDPRVIYSSNQSLRIFCLHT